MWKQLLIASFLAVLQVRVESDKVVCYYTTSAISRTGRGQMIPWFIDPFMCTHIIYGFVKLRRTSILPALKSDESERFVMGTYKMLTNLRRINPQLKIFLSVGGPETGSNPFMLLINGYRRRSSFAHNAVVFLRKYKFDGLDVAWMYPKFAIRFLYVKLMQDIRIEFEKEAFFTRKKRLLLSNLLASERMNYYLFTDLNKVVDIFNIVCYDLWGYWYKTTGHASALFKDRKFKGRPHMNVRHKIHSRNVNWVVQRYIEEGLSKRNMNLIFPMFATTSHRSEKNYYGIYGRSGKRPGHGGPLTKHPGMLAYYEICDILQNSPTVEVYHSIAQRAKYLIDGDLWASFEDPETMRAKACFVKVNDIGGIGFYGIENDDFYGNTCNQGPFPLIRSAMMEMNQYYLDHCFKNSSYNTPKYRPDSTAQPPGNADRVGRAVESRPLGLCCKVYLAYWLSP